MSRPDLVVFDCDGVLVDSERLTVAIESRVLGELGWPMTPAEVVDRWMGKTSQAQLADLTEHLGAARAREYATFADMVGAAANASALGAFLEAGQTP